MIDNDESSVNEGLNMMPFLSDVDVRFQDSLRPSSKQEK